jgi:hypothetical protein
LEREDTFSNNLGTTFVFSLFKIGGCIVYLR